MNMSTVLDQFDDRIGRYQSVSEMTLRFGLGVVILLGGAHKLLAPAVWHAYLAPPLLVLWPTAIAPLDLTFVLFGISEVVFGVLLLVDWHTPTVATITGLSLLGVVMNLTVGVIVGEAFIDVLIRDIGLTMLAFGVAFSVAGPE